MSDTLQGFIPTNLLYIDPSNEDVHAAKLEAERLIPDFFANAVQVKDGEVFVFSSWPAFLIVPIQNRRLITIAKLLPDSINLEKATRTYIDLYTKALPSFTRGVAIGFWTGFEDNTLLQRQLQIKIGLDNKGSRFPQKFSQPLVATYARDLVAPLTIALNSYHEEG